MPCYGKIILLVSTFILIHAEVCQNLLPIDSIRKKYDLLIFRFKYTRCNFAFFLQNYFSHLSVVTIVLLSIERCIILWSPFRARYLTSMRNAMIEECINLIVMFIITHFYLIPDYFASMDFSRCFYSNIFHIYHRKLVFDYKLYAIADIVFFSLLPCLLTTISIVLIIIGLKRHKRHRRFLRSNQEQQQPATSIYETSIVLVAIALLQVTTTFPLRLLLLLRYFISIELNLYTALYYLLSFNELLASTLNFAAFVLPFQNIRTEFSKVFFSFCYFQRHRSSTTLSTTPRIAILSSRF